MVSKWNGLERKTPLKRTPFKRKPKEKKDYKKTVIERVVRKVSLTDQLDRVFSLYIRLRDAMPGGRTVCISCGRQFPFEEMQAGHYFARHNMSVRWNESNVNSQCWKCNCDEHGNLDAYLVNLERKIGAEELQRLCALHNQVRKWSDNELKELIAHYKREVRRLSNDKDIHVSI